MPFEFGDVVLVPFPFTDQSASMQVFCTDLKNYDTFNRVYATYFHGKYPARAFIGASNLLFGARYEVMGIAVKPLG
ncbi:MAG TPA: Rid family hydrolase [Rhizomicrobium sp.]|jgi:enamine deaminase RidA (YjgF/YER057c/UK114 family)|nr:Rid family hydrolase [Rhizomicrobium sp.]